MLSAVTLMFQVEKVDSARHMPNREWWMFEVIPVNTMDVIFVQTIP
jgi:hypothetical protein